jgi:hypothetical protein
MRPESNYGFVDHQRAARRTVWASALRGVVEDGGDDLIPDWAWRHLVAHSFERQEAGAGDLGG